MKTKLIIGFAVLLGISCNTQPFTGRIVYKEYIAGHRCHTDGNFTVQQAGIIVTPRLSTPPPHHHSWTKASVTLWVANKNEIRQFSVDTLSFDKWVMGSKVTFK